MEPFAGSKEQFDRWLDSVVATFLELSPRQQESTLVSLIGESSPELKHALAGQVAEILQRDILSSLPRELVAKVCSYVDGESLRAACGVSRNWDRILSSLEEVWRAKCCQDGFRKMPGGCWRERYVHGQRFLRGVRSGEAFSCKSLRVNMFGGDGISELFVSDGYLFASAGKQVSAWRVGARADGVPALYFTARHRVSAMCERGPRSLALGHTSGHLSSWAWGGPGDGGAAEEASRVAAHVGPVACLAAAVGPGLLASGGADRCVKLWCLRTEQLLLRLAGFPSIVTRVMLMPTLYADESGSRRFVLLAKARNVIKLYRWSPKPSDVHSSCDHGVSGDEMSAGAATVATEDHCRSRCPDQFRLAGGTTLVHARTRPRSEAALYDVGGRREVGAVPLTGSFPFVLAAGEKFALLMQEAAPPGYGFALLNLHTRSEVAKWTLPASKFLPGSCGPGAATIPRCFSARLPLGCDRRAILGAAVPDGPWLDDLGHHSPGQLVLAFADAPDRINMVFWS
ncbi:F-box/WD repeat-containing protein 2-like [Bacillus rossius redtenbacheri]|uniref:F-box/WD repeat-containing protein 2-like n=1 Tax=Bacillus rossius redtenbacheri TaxID=93214 RepID=UPI002FDDB284